MFYFLIFADTHELLGLGQPALLGVALDDAILALCLFRAHNPALVAVEAALLLFALFVARIVQVAVANKVPVFDARQLLASAFFWPTFGIRSSERGATFTGGIFVAYNGDWTGRIVNFNDSLSLASRGSSEKRKN